MKRILKIQWLFRVLFLVVSALFGVATIASAATRNWDGDTSTNYSTGANWSSNKVPGASDSARFNNAFTGSNQPDLTGNVTLGRILFASNLAKDVTLSASSGTMTLNRVSGVGILNQSSGYNLLISAPLQLGNNQIWSGSTMTISGSVNTNARTLTLDPDASNTFTLSGAISGTGAVTQAGAGTVVYSGSSANTYTGITSVNAGTLTLNKTAGVDAIGGGSIEVNSGGTLLLASANQINDSVNITLDGGTFETGTTTGFSDTLGTLTLSSNSVIDLGSGVHWLEFAASNAVSWTGSTTLTINNWVGVGGSSGSQGQIYFGNSASGLTSAQLAQISFNGFGVGARLLANGELVPIPEADVILVACLILLMLAWREREAIKRLMATLRTSVHLT